MEREDKMTARQEEVKVNPGKQEKEVKVTPGKQDQETKETKETKEEKLAPNSNIIDLENQIKNLTSELLKLLSDVSIIQEKITQSSAEVANLELERMGLQSQRKKQTDATQYEKDLPSYIRKIKERINEVQLIREEQDIQLISLLQKKAEMHQGNVNLINSQNNATNKPVLPSYTEYKSLTKEHVNVNGELYPLSHWKAEPGTGRIIHNYIPTENRTLTNKSEEKVSTPTRNSRWVNVQKSEEEQLAWAMEESTKTQQKTKEKETESLENPLDGETPRSGPY